MSLRTGHNRKHAAVASLFFDFVVAMRTSLALSLDASSEEGALWRGWTIHTFGENLARDGRCSATIGVRCLDVHRVRKMRSAKRMDWAKFRTILETVSLDESICYK